MSSDTKAESLETRWYTLIDFLDLIRDYRYNNFCSYIPASGKHSGHFCGLIAKYAYYHEGRHIYRCTKCRHKASPPKKAKIVNTPTSCPKNKVALPLGIWG